MNTPWNTPVTSSLKLDWPDPIDMLHAYADQHLPLPSKETEKLTGEEKMALCIKAGVAVTLLPNGVVRTRHQVGIIKKDGKFNVIVDNVPRGKTVHFRVRHPF